MLRSYHLFGLLALLVLSVPAAAGTLPPDAVLTPLAADGASVASAVSADCLSCEVSQAESVISDDFASGARMALPISSGTWAWLDVAFGRAALPGSRVGFMLTYRGEIEQLLQSASLSALHEGEGIQRESRDGVDVQALSGGRYFVSVRANTPIDRLRFQLVGSPRIAHEVTVLYAVQVPPALIRRYSPSLARGARAAVGTARCTGCSSTPAEAIIDDEPSNRTTVRVSPFSGNAMARVDLGETVPAGSWVGFELQVQSPIEMSEILSATRLSALVGGRSVDVDGLDALAVRRSGGEGVTVLMRASEAIDGIALLLPGNFGGEVEYHIYSVIGESSRVPESAVPTVGIRMAPAATASVSAASNELALSAASPNPFHGVTRLGLSADPSVSVHVAAFDALGRRVAVLHDGAVGSGATVRFEADDLAPGLYMIRATADDGSRANRVVTVAR